MTDAPLPLRRLSQGHLNLLEQCPRKFQHTYLDQLASPVTLEQQQHIEWGNRFHLLMQQRELGLPLGAPASLEEAELQRCMQGLIAAAPEIFAPHTHQERIGFRQSEHRRTLASQGYLLTVIYDLVILEEQRGQILDWKTYPRPRDRDLLAHDWQTRLYLFVLAETSHLQPNQLSMTYWFVRPRPQARDLQPQFYTFTWSDRLHEETRQDLARLLNQLTQWLQDYETEIPFPQVSPSAGLCPSCTYENRCQRNSDGQDTLNPVNPKLEDVEEVVL